MAEKRHYKCAQCGKLTSNRRRICPKCYGADYYRNHKEKAKAYQRAYNKAHKSTTTLKNKAKVPLPPEQIYNTKNLQHMSPDQMVRNWDKILEVRGR